MNNFSSQYKVQVPLPLCLPSDITFDNYVISNNAELVTALKDAKEPLIFIWGANATGKSHLLNAIFNHYLEQDLAAYFLPLQMRDSLGVEMLENLEYQQLLCIDDIQAIAGNEPWEHALFHLFNRFKETGNKIVFSASANAENIPFKLADLKSRLQWGLTYHLAPLNDEEKIMALKIRAREKQRNNRE